MNFLLMDFGTTSIKTSIVDLDTGAFSYIKGHPSVSNLAVMPGRYEISPSSLRERFLSICDFYFAQLGIQFEGIAICSEQNGFVALNQENVPITNYISWKDERYDVAWIRLL
jgi:sugar (pentulose or hexulose) kinase